MGDLNHMMELMRDHEEVAMREVVMRGNHEEVVMRGS